jgi:hypothetical protein
VLVLLLLLLLLAVLSLVCKSHPNTYFPLCCTAQWKAFGPPPIMLRVHFAEWRGRTFLVLLLTLPLPA